MVIPWNVWNVVQTDWDLRNAGLPENVHARHGSCPL